MTVFPRDAALPSATLSPRMEVGVTVAHTVLGWAYNIFVGSKNLLMQMI